MQAILFEWFNFRQERNFLFHIFLFYYWFFDPFSRVLQLLMFDEIMSVRFTYNINYIFFNV